MPRPEAAGSKAIRTRVKATMTDWKRPALLRRYGIDVSRAIGILAMLGAPVAVWFLFGGRRYLPGVGAAYALALGASVWAARVGSEAQRAAAQDPTAFPEPLAPEWWRPPLVQARGNEISKVLVAAAIVGFPVAVCLGSDGRARPYALVVLYVLLLGGAFWTSAVGSEARRVAAQRAAAENAAAWAAYTAAQAAAQAQPIVGHGEPMAAQALPMQPPPPPSTASANAMQGPAMVAAGCGGIGLMMAVGTLALLLVGLYILDLFLFRGTIFNGILN